MWNKAGVWFSTIALGAMAMLHSFNGNQIEVAIYTSTVLGLVFLTSWFNKEDN